MQDGSIFANGPGERPMNAAADPLHNRRRVAAGSGFELLPVVPPLRWGWGLLFLDTGGRRRVEICGWPGQAGGLSIQIV